MLQKGDELMKNKKFLSICLLSIAASTLSGCGGASIPEVSEGKDTVVNELKGKPSENDPKNVVFATLGKLNAYQTYTKSSENHVTATKGVINYSQDTKATMIKNGDEFYTDSVSSSAFVDMQHTALVKNNKVAYKDKDSEIKNSTFDDYYSVYGVTPDKLLSGQIFNQDTILLASLTESSDNKYVYKLVLDKAKANDLIAHQTQRFGGLNGLPTYLNHTEFDLVIDETYTPISYTYKAKYNISINVLGDLTCEESCSATFSKFNETVEIPNSSALNAAINETPTEIHIDTDTTDYGDLSGLVSAALTSDFVNGVAISGNLKVKDCSIPLKLKLKGDVNKLIDTKDVVNGVDAQLIFSTVKGNVSVLLHENRAYLDLFDKKVVFALPETDVDFNEDVLEISSLISVKKSESKVNTYDVSLSDSGTALLKQFLVASGLVSQNDNLSFSCEVYVTNNHIAGIYLDLKVNSKTYLATDFIYQDEVFNLPDLTKYVSNLSFDTTIKFDVGGAKDNKLDIHFNYNTLERDIWKALDLKATLTLVDSIKSKLSFSGSFETPTLVSSLANSSYVDLILENGVLNAVVNTDSGVSYYQSINLKDLFTLSLGTFAKKGLLASSDSSYSFDFSKLLSAVRMEASLTGIRVYLDEDYVLETIDTLQVQGAFSRILISALGETGTTLLQGLNLNYPIATFEVSIPFSGDEKVSFALLGYKGADTAKGPWNTNKIKSYDKTSLFKVSFNNQSAEDKAHEYSYDYSSFGSIDATAKAYADEFKTLESNYALTDEYKASVNAYKVKYDALDRNVKYWVNNYLSYSIKTKGTGDNKVEIFPADNLLNTLTSEITKADEFINLARSSTADVNTLFDEKYKVLNSAQLAYINSKDATLLSTFIENKKNNESTAFANYLNKIAAFEFKDMSNMTESEIFSYYKSIDTLVSQKANYLSTDNSIDEFISQVKKDVVPLYVERMNAYMAVLAEEYLNFEVVDNLTVDEIKKERTFFKEVVKNYYSTFNSHLSFADCVSQDELTEFVNNIYLAQYCFQSGLGGFSKSMVIAVDKLMYTVLNKQKNDDGTDYTDAQKEEDLMTIWEVLDSGNFDFRESCTNYDLLNAKYADFINDEWWDLD